MKRMKLRQVLQSGRATVAALAGTAMVVGGAGAGTAALALGHSAGALSLQAPAIAVREQNVNAAGRIRVALPNGGVGVNGTVSVNNFPKSVNVGNLPLNSAGRVQVSTGSGTGIVSHTANNAANNVGSSPVTLVSAVGPGALQGLQLSIQNVSYNAINNVRITVVADGRLVFDRSWFAFICCWPSTPVLGATSPNANTPTSYASGYSGHQPSMWYYPPGGIQFQHSLQIQVQQPASNAGGQTDSIQAQYTTS